jgi:hypothetical protein
MMTEDLSGGWRQTHLGRLLGLAMRRFDERVLVLMASNVHVPLGCPTWRLAVRSVPRTSTSPATWPSKVPA